MFSSQGSFPLNSVCKCLHCADVHVVPRQLVAVVVQLTMSMPWYYLEKPTRIVLLRCYYAVCALTYPVFVGLNWKSYAPSRAEVLAGGRSLKEEILNPRNIKK